MQKSASSARPPLSTLAGLCLAALALCPAARAQTTIAYTDTQVLTTARTTTPANPLTLTIASGTAMENGVVSGDGSVTKTGAGTLKLGATNTYSGGTFLDAGTIELSADNALGTGAITLTGGGLRAGGQARTLSNALFTSGTFTVGRATTFAGTTTLTAATTIVASNPDGLANSNMTFSGPISGNFGLTLAAGAGGLGIGSGYLVFSGTNTYTGGTTLRTRLSIASDTALGAASGALTMDGGTLRGTASINSTRNVILGTGGGTLDLGSSSGFAGTISGSGALTKSGAGTLTLSGTNTYTGGTTITAGNVQIGNGGTTGSILGDVVDNTSLTFNRSNALTYAGVISGSGSVTHAGTGTLTLSGTNTYEGGTTVTGYGTIEFSSNASLGTGNITLNGGGLKWAAGNTTDISSRLNNVGTNAAIFDTNGNNVSFASSIAGDPGYSQLVKTGAGTLTLSGATNTEFDVMSGTLDFGTGTYHGTLYAGLATSFGLDPQNYGPSAVILSGTGTSFHADGDTSVGEGSEYSASLTISNGASLSTASTQVGTGSTAESTLTVTGAGSSYTGSSSLSIGTFAGGRSSFIVSNGASATTGDPTYLGYNSIGESLLAVSGSGSTFTSTGTLYIGQYAGSITGTSLMIVSGGASASADTTVIGSNGARGANSLTITGTGSTFTNTGSLTLAVGASDNGTLNLGSAVGNAATAAGILNAATVTGGAGVATLQFNTTGTALAPTYFTRDGTRTGTGVNTTGGLSLVNTAGTTVLTGTLAHTGATTVNGGRLVVDGSITSSAVTINTGGTLGGHGTLGALMIASGGILSPGNSPGRLSAGDTSFAGSGKFVFEVNNATGTPGTHYDLLAINGTLTLTATSANPFFLDVTSLKLLDSTAGLAANFDSAANYSFTFLTTTGGITGFAADAFAIDTTGFTNPFNGTWSVSLTNTGHDLTLSYGGGSAISAVPEPSTYAAILGACALAAAAWRKRRPAGQTHRVA